MGFSVGVHYWEVLRCARDGSSSVSVSVCPSIYLSICLSCLLSLYLRVALHLFYLSTCA